MGAELDYALRKHQRCFEGTESRFDSSTNVPPVALLFKPDDARAQAAELAIESGPSTSVPAPGTAQLSRRASMKSRDSPEKQVCCRHALAPGLSRFDKKSDHSYHTCWIDSDAKKQ